MKAIKYFISVFLLFSGISVSLVAQDKIAKGRIIDAETKKPIPYVNIGIYHKNIGTVSNENGQFQFAINGNSTLNDLVVFSHIGYQTAKYSISQLENPIADLQLFPVSNFLQEIIIKPKKAVTSFIGRNGKGLGLIHYNFYTYSESEINDRLGKEAGIVFPVKKDCYLNELQMHISSNEFSNLKFRLNFYKIVNDVPSEKILTKEVIFEIKDGFVGLYRFDLRTYDLFLTKDMENVAATIQWVESRKAIPSSKYFSLYSSASTHSSFVGRAKSMAMWEKSKHNISLSFLAECD